MARRKEPKRQKVTQYHHCVGLSRRPTYGERSNDRQQQFNRRYSGRFDLVIPLDRPPRMDGWQRLGLPAVRRELAPVCYCLMWSNRSTVLYTTQTQSNQPMWFLNASSTLNGRLDGMTLPLILVPWSTNDCFWFLWMYRLPR